ncbi:hypothetical protein AGMMS50262_22640 [Bacteroidia bacterium]|nr:hypothetical protein AGMMS50262_22640 [Bacteroidia bacterium]
MNPKVVTENGLTIDLSQVKCFKREESFNDRCRKIIIELKTRYEYIKHPGTGKFIKQKINDTVEYECCDYETACQYQIELKETWQKNLDE